MRRIILWGAIILGGIFLGQMVAISVYAEDQNVGEVEKCKDVETVCKVCWERLCQPYDSSLPKDIMVMDKNKEEGEKSKTEGY